jgi:hypothetical protein
MLAGVVEASSRTFALAPMSPLFRWLTAALLVIPPAFVALGLATRATLLAPVGLLVAVLYAWIWLRWRPVGFEIAPDGLAIRFPGLRLELAGRDIAAVRLLTGEAFREEFGLAFRIGVGGLWGGFGWLWTSRRGLVEFYVSRLDAFVLIERRGDRPLLFTPENPEEFVEVISATL